MEPKYKDDDTIWIKEFDDSHNIIPRQAAVILGSAYKVDDTTMYGCMIIDGEYAGDGVDVAEVQIEGLVKWCKNHPDLFAEQELDGEDLCIHCCNRWAKNEGKVETGG